LHFVDWQGLHQYHCIQQGSHISDFYIGRGNMMAKQKTKSASKKDAGAKSKARTGSEISSSPKTAKTATAKKVVKKKTSDTATKTKKTKTPAAKKVATAAKTKIPAKKAATGKTNPAATGNKAATKPSPEERYRMVETAAYFIAEKHGFQGRSDEHWAAAERAIALKLGQ
jgi:hypothetical protein